jgi:hypothetical protein
METDIPAGTRREIYKGPGLLKMLALKDRQINRPFDLNLQVNIQDLEHQSSQG